MSRSRGFPSGAPARVAAVLLLLATLLAAGGGEASAQGYFGKNKVHWRDFDWHLYRSPHFDIYYYPDSEPFLEQMVSYAESAYLYLSRDLDHEVKFRIPLIYYRTHAEFEQTNVDLSEIPQGVLAFAEPLKHRMVMAIDLPPDKLYELIIHELTHIFEFSILFQDSLGRAVRSGAPLWLMEGLASHMARDEDNLDIMVIRDAVIHGLVPPITKVRGLTFLTYRFGQAAFDFIEQEWGREGITTFLSEYRRILLSRNIEKAIKEAFGIEADEFDRRFQKYLRRKYLPALLEKDEPADYGKEIGIKLPGVVTFSPTLSPSGDLVAVLTNRYDDLDVVILNARDGEVIKNITKGFTNDYEYITTQVFNGSSDLAWSPDGDMLGFFVRRKGGRALMIKNALTGKQVKLIDLHVANAASPSFSPDGQKIIFSANSDGQVDIFEIDYATEQTRNLTDDEYYDSNPSWSADGKSILYNRRVDAYEKIFLMDYQDPSRRTQITFGTTSELMPSFTRDGKRILYSADANDDGIFNLYSINIDTGEVLQYTDVMGGFFQAQDRPSDGGRDHVVASTYVRGTFRLFDVDVTKPIKVITPEERVGTLEDIEPFEPPLQLTVDEKEKQEFFKKTYHVESVPQVQIGLANDGTVFGNAAVVFSDLLGDNRFWGILNTVADFQNIDLGYINLSSRLWYHFRGYDVRDFILVPTGGNTFTRVDASRITGGEGGLSYPLGRFYRVETTLGVMNRDVFSSDTELISGSSDPFDPNAPEFTSKDFSVLSFRNITSTNAVVGAGLVGDTLRYREFGAYHGKRFRLGVASSPFATGADAPTFTSYSLDFRAYGRVTRRSLFAYRLYGLIQEGEGSTLFGIGGYNQLRGYRFREFIGDRAALMNLEFRYPLVDEVRFPFGSIRQVRGLIFLDLGTAWTRGGQFFDDEFGQFFSVGGLFRDFKWWDSDAHALHDLRGSYGLGFSFRMGFLELNWTFAKTLEHMELDASSCRQEIIASCKTLNPNDPGCFFDFDELDSALNNCKYEKVPTSNWKSDFYIGYAF
jgi:WD40 repeat protein